MHAASSHHIALVSCLTVSAFFQLPGTRSCPPLLSEHSNGPFKVVSNGYFAAWAAFLFSTQYAYSASNMVRTMLDRGATALNTNNQPNAGGEPNPDQSSSV
jgi:hypothetical protein